MTRKRETPIGVSSRTWLLVATTALGLVGLAGCWDRAAASDCTFVFDRIVALELERRGFRDPALRERKSNELRAALRSEIGMCAGHRLPAGARACVAKAKSAASISQHCLR
jgi:hypothetical protein